MTKRASINRYNLIIKRFKKSPAIFQKINDYLERESEMHEEKYTISKRTFQRDVLDIASLYKYRN
ncbi:MAG: hypothetical protein ACOCWB_08500 [Bacteroidota bacterium]